MQQHILYLSDITPEALLREICEAAEDGVPVVAVQVQNQGFVGAGLKNLLDSLEAQGPGTPDARTTFALARGACSFHGDVESVSFSRP